MGAAASGSASDARSTGARSAMGSWVMRIVPVRSAVENSTWAGAHDERAVRRANLRGLANRDDPLGEIDHDVIAVTCDAKVRPVHGDADAFDVHRKRLAVGDMDDLSLDGAALETEHDGPLACGHPVEGALHRRTRPLFDEPRRAPLDGEELAGFQVSAFQPLVPCADRGRNGPAFAPPRSSSGRDAPRRAGRRQPPRRVPSTPPPYAGAAETRERLLTRLLGDDTLEQPCIDPRPIELGA